MGTPRRTTPAIPPRVEAPDQGHAESTGEAEQACAPGSREGLGPGPPSGRTGHAGLDGPRPETGEEILTLSSELARRGTPDSGRDQRHQGSAQHKPEGPQAPTRETNQRHTCARAIWKGTAGRPGSDRPTRVRTLDGNTMPDHTRDPPRVDPPTTGNAESTGDAEQPSAPESLKRLC
jgi:hypothetical protein